MVTMCEPLQKHRLYNIVWIFERRQTGFRNLQEARIWLRRACIRKSRLCPTPINLHGEDRQAWCSADWMENEQQLSSYFITRGGVAPAPASGRGRHQIPLPIQSAASFTGMRLCIYLLFWCIVNIVLQLQDRRFDCKKINRKHKPRICAPTNGHS